ncbi:endo-1,3-alpha-glucanase family glycosylhydrolase [Streptomyces sp. NPDC050743]|uniref:endo-1,3-alpha-glucanase family glycosylhydrolase n=1 Tax=Streptomyces sp. NPDC050743 TaxID=3365634 RepID=UPI0037BAFC8E
MRRTRAALAALPLMLGLLGSQPAQAAAAVHSGAGGGHIPLLAYYYQWFQPSSWQRAKIDYPQLGRYSSDDTGVMRAHIAWAKSAGIDGFIVSWKSTPVNNRRLRLLMSVAATENFKITVIYQGLDFQRRPLPTAEVTADFAAFAKWFADSPVLFRLDGKPLTVFSGTWAYTHDEVAHITRPVRSKLLVLNTEKNERGYERLADVTDGDAYYWSSVNPDTNPNHAAKLDAMGQAVHTHRGYWVAPFAPGFDARLVGGTKEVPRKNGATLRAEYTAAVGSQPDVLGLISWNEFSENSYVEPSVATGRRYLDLLRELRGGAAAGRTATHVSPAPGPHRHTLARSAAERAWPNMLRLAGFAAVLVAAVTLLARRRAGSGIGRPGSHTERRTP